MSAGRCVQAALTLAVAWGLWGCVAFPVGGGEKTYDDSPSLTQPYLQREHGGGTVLRPESVEYYPEATREGDTVRIRLVAEGRFTAERTENRRFTVTPEEKMAVGLVPGMASLPERKVVGGTVLAAWYNVLFLGTPTLSGLFIEPFLPPIAYDARGAGNTFRRSALFGFHRYKMGGHSGKEAPETIRGPVDATKQPVLGATFSFRAEKPFWKQMEMDESGVSLYGVEPGAHVGLLRLETLPADHTMRDDLEAWKGGRWIEVAIPEK